MRVRKDNVNNRIIVYFLLILTAAVSWVVTGSHGMLIISIILLILPCASYIYTGYISRNITLHLDEIKGTLVRGDKTQFHITVSNSFYIPAENICIQMVFCYNNDAQDISKKQWVSVGSREKTDIYESVRLEYAGMLTVDVRDSWVYDTLRLFRFRINGGSQSAVTVLPVLHEPDFQALYTASDDMEDSREYSDKRKGDDVSEIFDVREYAPGDSLNRIHWKLSAKADELLVKDFSRPVSCSNCILVGMSRPDNAEERCNLNGIYEMVYAIGHLACLKEKAFKLVYSDSGKNFRELDIICDEELDEAMRQLIREELNASAEALEYFIESGLDKGVRRLYYVTDRLTDVQMELADRMECAVSVYRIGGQDTEGQATKLERSLIIDVNRDDIAWGISNTII